MPTCWIIAGPNGAGKTTFALQYLPQVAHCTHFINADLIAAGLSPLAPERELAAASRLLLHEVEACVQRRADFALETTLAGRGYLKLVKRLRAEGWHMALIYLAAGQRNVSHRRVAERVAQGGHNIPTADIDRRFGRSLRHLLQAFSHQVDHCECFINVGPSPQLVFVQDQTQRVIHHDDYYRHLVQESQT